MRKPTSKSNVHFLPATNKAPVKVIRTTKAKKSTTVKKATVTPIQALRLADIKSAMKQIAEMKAMDISMLSRKEKFEFNNSLLLLQIAVTEARAELGIKDAKLSFTKAVSSAEAGVGNAVSFVERTAARGCNFTEDVVCGVMDPLVDAIDGFFASLFSSKKRIA